MKRLGPVLGVCLLVAVGMLPDGHLARAQQPKKRWNFLLVVVDTLRYDATSLAGTSDTPFLQSVARRGVSYTRAYSTHDNTPASHFSLLTGFRNGLRTPKLDRPDVALPYQLGQFGYSTFGISANGTLSQSTMATLGGFRHYSCLFDEWRAMESGERDRVRKEIDQKLRRYGARLNDFNRDNGFCTGERVLAELPGMLESVTEPFFGFLNIMEPHDPYLPSEASLPLSRFDKRVDPDLRFRPLRFPLTRPEDVAPPARRQSILTRLAAAEGRAWSLADDLSKEQLDTYRRRYQGEVRDADAILRRIVLMLEARGLLDNTWLIVAADHGEAFGEAGFVSHWLSDAGDREATRHVPLVWSGPVRFQTSLRVTEEVSLMDVAPTICDLAGIDWRPIAALSPDVPFGRSLVYQLTGSVVSGGRSVPRFGAEMPASQQEILRKEALDRLRALGYIR